MRKATEERIMKLEKKVDQLFTCRHDLVFVEWCGLFGAGYKEVCDKCGFVSRHFNTEAEYLEAKLKHDADQCKATNNATKARLQKLIKEE